jgi:hippurate hydrolase
MSACCPNVGFYDAQIRLYLLGRYVWIGSGPVEASQFLHNPRYDFNDDILPIGASYWARLVESELPRKA